MGSGTGTYVISKSRSSITSYETGRINQAIADASSTLQETVSGVKTR